MAPATNNTPAARPRRMARDDATMHPAAVLGRESREIFAKKSRWLVGSVNGVVEILFFLRGDTVRAPSPAKPRLNARPGSSARPRPSDRVPTAAARAMDGQRAGTAAPTRGIAASEG